MDLPITGLSVSKCTVNVTQPQEHLHGRFNQSINISCHVSRSCQNKKPDVQWYVFTTDSYYQLDIKNQPMKYKLQDADLHITCLSHGDDGVYYCAASDNDSKNSGAQAIGTGTTLTVKGKMPCCFTDDVLIFESLLNLSSNSSLYSENDSNTGQVLLLTLVVLLSLYSLIILALFICIKVKCIIIIF